jgi:hypothetical protein
MPAIDDAIELGASRPGQQLDPDLERLRDAPDRGDRHAVEPTSLDARHRSRRYAGGRSQIDLAPRSTGPGGADGGTKPQVFHRRES